MSTATIDVEAAKQAFLGKAEALGVTIGTSRLIMEPRQFSSGSVGWFCSGKATVNGILCQVSMNVVAVGSGPVSNDKAKAQFLGGFQSDKF